MRFLILAVVTSCLATEVRAENYESIVQHAFEINERTSEDEWAYTVAITADGVTRIQRFDPRQPAGEQWTLISVDSVPPISKEQNEFMREKSETGDSEDEDESFGPDSITPGSLELIEETDAEYRFRFQPKSEGDSEDAEFMRHVSGELSVNKSGLFIESIGLKSTNPFKPGKGIKINKFELSMRYGRTTVNDQIVLLSANARVVGRAYFVYKIDEAQEAVYSDYEWVADQKGY